MELGEGVDCVIGFVAAGVGGVGERDLKAGLIGESELGHGYAVGEAGGGAGWFEGLKAYRSEKDLVEMKGLLGGAGNGDVGEMGWVEAAAEEGYAHLVMVAEGSLPQSWIVVEGDGMLELASFKKV